MQAPSPGAQVHYKNKRGECQVASITRVVDEEQEIVDLHLAQPAEHQNREYLDRPGVRRGTDYKTWHEIEPEGEEVTDGAEA